MTTEDDDFTTPIARNSARVAKASKSKRRRTRQSVDDPGRVLDLLSRLQRGTLPPERWEALP